MMVKFFAGIRSITGCRESDIHHQADLRGLLCALGEQYGLRMRQKVLARDGQGLGAEIVILVNGRHVEHIGGIDAPLGPDDVVQIFPLVAGG